MNSYPPLTQKEISPGIILLKQVNSTPHSLIYIFKVQLNRLNECEFQADFTGSENIILEQPTPNNKLLSLTIIQPFETQEVAKLILNQDWKLKTKFKFTLRPTSKAIQLKYISDDLNLLKQDTINALQKIYNLPINHKEVNEIIKFLNNDSFIDIDFLPVDENVFGILADSDDLDTLVQWRRPSQYYMIKDLNKKPEIFFDKLEPTDIKQGALGNCWFLSALSTLAERPTLIKRLFVTNTVNSSGIYRVKLCKNGEWQFVTIDDLFPCYPQGTPIFSQCHSNELWVLILEKAYAKLHGSYFQLKYGITNEALIDFTGCPTTTIFFDCDKLQKNYSRIWQVLTKYDQEGYLINAFTEGYGQETAQIPQDYLGLIPGHAYSILEIKDVKGIQLLRIRNPWGDFEWKGDWSDTSPLWTQEMKGLVNFVNDSGNSQFWMCLKDFLVYFRGANICKVRNWDEVRIKGKFVKVSDLNDPNIQVVLSKWYYTFNLQQQTKVVLGVHQEDEKCLGVDQLRRYLDIAITIFKKADNGTLDLISQTTLQVERQIELELELSPGQYLILPRTSGLNLKKPFNSHTNQDIQLLVNDELHPLVKSTIADIFRKFDMLLTRELSYIEFKGFYECLDKQIEPLHFKNFILNKYCSTEKGLTLKGFYDFFYDSIKSLGSEPVRKWFEKLGYDRDLYSVRARAFILTIHSTQEIAVTVRDALNTDLDNRAHVFASTQLNNEYCLIEQLRIENDGVRIIQCFNRLCEIYTIIAVNDQSYPVEVSLDLTASQGLIYSTKNSYIKKILQAGQMECMIHFKGIQKYKISLQCKWIPT